MGVAEVDRIRARRLRVIVDRPWADVMLDDAVAAVRRRVFESGTFTLGAARGDPERRALRVEALARAAVGHSGAIEALALHDRVNPHDRAVQRTVRPDGGHPGMNRLFEQVLGVFA